MNTSGPCGLGCAAPGREGGGLWLGGFPLAKDLAGLRRRLATGPTPLTASCTREEAFVPGLVHEAPGQFHADPVPLRERLDGLRSRGSVCREPVVLHRDTGVDVLGAPLTLSSSQPLHEARPFGRAGRPRLVRASPRSSR